MDTIVTGESNDVIGMKIGYSNDNNNINMQMVRILIHIMAAI